MRNQISCKNCNKLTNNEYFCSKKCSNFFHSKDKKILMKIGKASKRNWELKEFRDKQTISHSKNTKETWKNPAIREKRIKGIKNAYNGDMGTIRKNKISKRDKEMWKNKDELQKKHIINSLNSKDSVLRRNKNIIKKWKDINFINKMKVITSSIEHRNKISNATKDAMNNIEIRRKCAKGGFNQRGIPKPKLTEETKQKIRKYRATQIFPKKDTKIEIKIRDFLDKLKLEYFQHKYMNIEHGYQCDFFIPNMNLIIECDGDYWHKYPIGRDIDNIRTKELIEKGFKVLRLWEHEIYLMTVNKFKDQLIKC